ncbi:hypothetical protein DPMN_120791 [Dreissena polymorpha]|uniref:MAM domain-containing protein n=1 Tax=Dreissena polymorpha TaxID=45954 RepID=A0A9D4GKG2_DREPO|nr:hypothetical protein DPMN_120791 [Dreissena polymorpha]
METSSNCPWHNVASLDQMNWIVHNGSTPTDDTGPTVDHTFGNNSGTCIRSGTGIRKIA